MCWDMADYQSYVVRLLQWRLTRLLRSALRMNASRRSLLLAIMVGHNRVLPCQPSSCLMIKIIFEMANRTYDILLHPM